MTLLPIPAPPAGDTESLVTPTLAAGLELIAARRLGNLEDARDAAQETLSRALAALRAGRSPDAAEFIPYVHGILRHVIADMRRRTPWWTLEGDPLDFAPSALDCLVRDEQRTAVRHALGLLDTADRALLGQCFGEGRRITAIAAESGEPAARLRKRKSRALARLKLILGGHETPEESMNKA